MLEVAEAEASTVLNLWGKALSEVAVPGCFFDVRRFGRYVALLSQFQGNPKQADKDQENQIANKAN